MTVTQVQAQERVWTVETQAGGTANVTERHDNGVWFLRCSKCEMKYNPHKFIGSSCCVHVATATKQRLDAGLPEGHDKIGVLLFVGAEPVTMKVGPPDTHGMRSTTLDLGVLIDGWETLGYVGPSDGRAEARHIALASLVEARGRARCQSEQCNRAYLYYDPASPTAVENSISILTTNNCVRCKRSDVNGADLIPNV